MGDECLYFRLGHQRYFEAVAEKDLYKINPRDKPWERTHIHECELVKVTGIKYVIKPPRVACLRLSCALEGGGRGRAFTVRYHDMADVIDFLVLKQQYDLAVARRWGPGDRFRCMIDDAWWSGEVVERAARVEEAGAGADAEAEAEAGAFSAAAAAHFLSLKVRWDNGEVERLSPWDLEPVDPDRVSSEAGGAVPVLARELEAVLYRPRPHEWPPAGHRTPACRAIAQHLSQVMSLSVAEPFVAPVDLSLYPEYARVIPYPIDLATVRARSTVARRRRSSTCATWRSNAEQFNEPHSAIVRQARLVTDLLLHIIGAWRTVDVVAKYRELAATYHSSDDEPLARAAAVNRKNMNGVGASGRGGGGGGGWEEWCARVLRELMASADAEPFKRPVSLDMAPDYLSVVSQPMDLGTVESRLRARRYRSPRQFARDIRLVFDNSRLYNTNQRSRVTAHTYTHTRTRTQSSTVCPHN
ncbi:unnamed protein product [Diatraea saccharalis]|uniref:Bromo domain-containing protein n=1 Tax=Diatraea saccharalis TaxID=40085 RepID=A0A9N9R5L9_9NEOP|nr:unnamed protein product [Diatraea saccharalis]